ncbi:proline dehydrogenase family protein [Bacillus marasmi]|uniref:proline dehydrogenase family protein n=1 Tax=Bacillus marasmi TaxID=1926279 RepID=UPI0011C971FF|nr:proline dehydrogenase [Bacillus marasmi]
MKQVLRDVFLFLSKNKALTTLAKRYGLNMGASRFVAGETINAAMDVIKLLNDQDLVVTLDYLGEFVDNEVEANLRAKKICETIEAIANANLNSQVSLKLTSLGLDISEEIVLENLRMILLVAEHNNIFVTIDMEDFKRCQKTLDIYKELRKEFNGLGTVIQAYLYRSERDVGELIHYQSNLRLVKGAYKEPPEVAFPNKSDVDINYKKLIKQHLLNGYFTAIATHDDAIIEYTKRMVQAHKIPHDQFEFQMLYGIRPEKQLELVNEGYTMRVYVPFGADWYGYFMRRLAERPANVAFVMKGMFRR